MIQDKISYPYLPDFQISPLSSLNFDHKWRLPWQYPCCYIQKFITLDKIRVQYAATDRYPFNVYLKDQSTGTSTKLTPEVMDGVIAGRMTFQRAFSVGDLTTKGNFKTLRMLDDIFTFTQDK